MPNLFLKINKKSIRLMQFNLILAIWLGLILNYSFFEKINKLTPYQGIKSMLLLAATIIVIIAVYNLLLQLINWRWSAKFFSTLLIIIGGLSAYFVNSLGVIITPDQIQNLLQTDVKEAKDLWSIRLVIWILFFIIFPLSVVAILRIEQEPLQKNILKKR